MIQATLFHITLGTLLVVSLIYSNISWRFKAIIVVATFICSALVVYDIQNKLGYPVVAELPDEFVMVWGKVEEPSMNNPGRIIFWIVDGSKDPRAIIRPYTKGDHKAVKKILDAVKESQRQVRVKKAIKKKAPNGSEAADDSNASYDIKGFEIPSKTD